MKVRAQIEALGGWIRGGIATHPLLAACVAFLVLKQLAVVWVFLGRPQLPPNMVLSLAGAALLFVPWAFVLRGAGRLVALAVVDALFGAVLLLDLTYFRQFADLPSVASLKYAGLAFDVHGAIEGLLRPTDLLLFAGAPILLALAVGRGAWLERQPRITARRAALLATVGVAVIASVTVTTRRLKKPFGGHTVVASRVGPLGYHAYDAGVYFARQLRRSFGATEAHYQEAKAFFRERDAGQAQLAGSAKGMNVIYVQLESWQAFATEMEVGGKSVTPHFDKLAAESIHLTRFHAQVGQGSTADAELGAQCSLYPTRTGSVYYEYAANDLRCLPEVLRDAGYTTAAFHANRPDFWNRAAMYPSVGISSFFDERTYTAEPHIGLGLGDVEFFDQTVDKLLELPQPFYAMVISLTSHSPFDFPNLPRELDHGVHAATRTAHYLDTVRYTDEALGKLVERLEREGLLDRSILVVYGDHMGVSKESSNVGEVLALRDDDAAGWFDTERRVPALIRLPGGAGAGKRALASGHLDLPPTVLSLVGLESAPTAFFGQNLLAAESGFVAFPNGSATTDDRLFLTADGAHGRGGCFALPDKTRLPGEACADLEERAVRELHLAWRLIDGDLVARVANAPDPSVVTQLE